MRAQTGRLALVVNTHWHSDHVSGNALLQTAGAGIAAATPDAHALARRDPGCCQAEYLDHRDCLPAPAGRPEGAGMLPAHGPIPADPGAALAAATRRAQRLADDPGGAVWYGARRIFAFAPMIRDGIPAADVEPYLNARRG